MIREVNGHKVGSDPRALQDSLRHASGSVVLKILPSYQEPPPPRQVRPWERPQIPTLHPNPHPIPPSVPPCIPHSPPCPQLPLPAVPTPVLSPEPHEPLSPCPCPVPLGCWHPRALSAGLCVQPTAPELSPTPECCRGYTNPPGSAQPSSAEHSPVQPNRAVQTARTKPQSLSSTPSTR